MEEMEYNTTRGKLILPEYGRNVQNMISHAMELENRIERNRAAQAIIEVMGQLNPHLRDVDDYRHKLWTHLFVMSDFMLDVDSPYDIPKPEALNEKPSIMDYPISSIKYGHYGKYTQAILEASIETTDPKEKEYLKTSMANFMKKQYLSHNNDAVENNVIAENLKELSKGDLILENPDDLVNTSTILREMGLNKKFTKPNNNYKQKKKFKKQ
jgi:hypothetical protein